MEKYKIKQTKRMKKKLKKKTKTKNVMQINFAIYENIYWEQGVLCGVDYKIKNGKNVGNVAS